MVLEDSSAVDTSPLDAGAPPSDDDPYSNSQSRAGFHIDRSGFPKPIPIIGPLFGYNDKLFSRVLQQKAQVAGTALKRPVNQDEANALAYWTAKQISIFSYGAPLGIAAGWWRAYSTTSTFGFPFWKPNLETFNAEVWPPRIGLLRGNRAIAAWHATRMLAYGVVGNYVGQILFGSYSMSVSTVGELSDPRLKDYMDAIRQQAQQRRGTLPNPSRGPAVAHGPQQRDRRHDTTEDASPTGGLYGDDGDDSAGFENDTEGGIAEENLSVQGRGIRWPQANQTQPLSAGQTGPSVTQDRSFDPFDDASPTGEQGVTADTTPSDGSAWERIRRGAISGSGGKPASNWPSARSPQAPGQGSTGSWKKQSDAAQREDRERTTGDSFAFSKADEEQNSAREKAQKEFDARVERERRGGDFSSSGGDQRRW